MSARFLAPLAVSLALMATASSAQNLSPKEEVQILLERLEQSDCRFERNGDWHDGEAAASHLRKKLRVALMMGKLDRAETFIIHVASKSSQTDKPYHVACPGQSEMPASDWMLGELAAIRRQ